jgi:uncharacterized membrane protein YcaP (DUF421 family)
VAARQDAGLREGGAAMRVLDSDSWQRMFLLDIPLLEIVIRGTLMYLAVFVLMRVIIKRQPGGIGISDVLVLVLIADAAQNGMTGDYGSITGGVVLVVTIMLCDLLIDWLAFQFPIMGKFLLPSPLLLVRNGRLIHSNLRRELLTVDEVESMLRQNGVDDVRKVKRAYMEQNGKISVVTFDNQRTKTPEQPGLH